MLHMYGNIGYVTIFDMVTYPMLPYPSTCISDHILSPKEADCVPRNVVIFIKKTDGFLTSVVSIYFRLNFTLIHRRHFIMKWWFDVVVYVGDDTGEEPDFQYIPDTHGISSSAHTDSLSGSLMLLQEALESGAAIAQFEVSVRSISIDWFPIGVLVVHSTETYHRYISILRMFQTESDYVLTGLDFHIVN